MSPRERAIVACAGRWIPGPGPSSDDADIVDAFRDAIGEPRVREPMVGVDLSRADEGIVGVTRWVRSRAELQALGLMSEPLTAWLLDGILDEGSRRRRSRALDPARVAWALAVHHLSRPGGGDRSLEDAASLLGSAGIGRVIEDWPNTHRLLRVVLGRNGPEREVSLIDPISDVERNGSRVASSRGVVGRREPRPSGSDLRRARLAHRLSQSDQARRLGVSRQRVGAIERATRPHASTASRYIAALGAAAEETSRCP